ncbi:hypothetical protein [Nostoc sp. C057]|uniref:hypothetical protein n=1 Tax=Nostoc sp. C057 TaxID=2576903 RepID=UPI0015C3DB26|nr:hypothetical protein [Nostoc sp. C057]
MPNISINSSKLNSIINRAFDVAVDALADSFQNAIASDIWEWRVKPSATMVT